MFWLSGVDSRTAAGHRRTRDYGGDALVLINTGGGNLVLPNPAIVCQRIAGQWLYLGDLAFDRPWMHETRWVHRIEAGAALFLNLTLSSEEAFRRRGARRPCAATLPAVCVVPGAGDHNRDSSRCWTHPRTWPAGPVCD
jgi:hypothetical protein